MRPALVINALVGYGLVDAPRGPIARAIQWINACDALVLSLDVPSGVDATTGGTPGDAVRPHATLTLALPKTGLASADSGVLWLADLGIPAAVYRRIGLNVPRIFGSAFRVPLQAQRVLPAT